MLSTAQKSRATNKPQPGAGGGFTEKPKACVGAGNRHRAGTTQLPGILQAKLTIGKANDSYEQEADRVAGEVMGMSNESKRANLDSPPGGGQSIQRQCACGGGCDHCKKKQLSLKRATASSQEAGEIPASVHEVLQSAGQPLAASTRAFMEPRFGYDFSSVRVHTDSAAARSAREVSAHAFTVGSHIAFAAGRYVAGSVQSNRLLAHELTHVVQQGGAGPQATAGEQSTVRRRSETTQSQTSGVLQRAGDPAAIPVGFPCPTDFTTSRPTGADLRFPSADSTVTAAHRTQLNTVIAAWVASGGTDEMIVHGYASRSGAQAANWTLSCDRAQNVRDALLGLGVPAVHIRILAHGESTDFGAGNGPNQHAVVSTSPGGLFSPPLVFGRFSPLDEFPGRSHARFGVDELIFLDFFSHPSTPAADFGGLEWHLVSGRGTLSGVNPAGTATFRAPDRAEVVTFELRVASGPTVGRVVTRNVISIVEPSAVNMVEIAGSGPSFGGWGQPAIPAGTWGVGFRTDIFIDPKEVSFLGVSFGEGATTGVVTPAGSFLSGRHGLGHAVGADHAGGLGNAVTGTPLAPAQDGIWMFGGVTPRRVRRVLRCGNSRFLWAIPWFFTVGSGGRVRIAGFTADQIITSNLACEATAAKAGAGPVCRRINGTRC